MSNIPDPPTTVNAPTTNRSTPRTTVPDPPDLSDLRNDALAAHALAEAVNDTLEALPPGTIDERLLMLMVMCEEKCAAVFTGTDALAAQPR